MQLSVSSEITSATRLAASKGMTYVAELMGRVHGTVPMRKTPIAFVMTLMNSVAESTIEFMTQEPANAKKHSKVGFEALWRMVA